MTDGQIRSSSVGAVAVAETNPDVVYVAALGHPYGPNDERGVFKSADGGTTWKKVLFRSNRVGAVDLVIDRNDPDVLFASVWEVDISNQAPGHSSAVR